MAKFEEGDRIHWKGFKRERFGTIAETPFDGHTRELVAVRFDGEDHDRHVATEHIVHVPKAEPLQLGPVLRHYGQWATQPENKGVGPSDGVIDAASDFIDDLPNDLEWQAIDRTGLTLEQCDELAFLFTSEYPRNTFVSVTSDEKGFEIRRTLCNSTVPHVVQVPITLRTIPDDAPELKSHADGGIPIPDDLAANLKDALESGRVLTGRMTSLEVGPTPETMEKLEPPAVKAFLSGRETISADVEVRWDDDGTTDREKAAKARQDVSRSMDVLFRSRNELQKAQHENDHVRCQQHAAAVQHLEELGYQFCFGGPNNELQMTPPGYGRWLSLPPISDVEMKRRRALRVLAKAANFGHPGMPVDSTYRQSLNVRKQLHAAETMSGKLFPTGFDYAELETKLVQDLAVPAHLLGLKASALTFIAPVESIDDLPDDVADGTAAIVGTEGLYVRRDGGWHLFTLPEPPPPTRFYVATKDEGERLPEVVAPTVLCSHHKGSVYCAHIVNDIDGAAKWHALPSVESHIPFNPDVYPLAAKLVHALDALERSCKEVGEKVAVISHEQYRLLRDAYRSTGQDEWCVPEDPRSMASLNGAAGMWRGRIPLFIED